MQEMIIQWAYRIFGSMLFIHSLDERGHNQCVMKNEADTGQHYRIQTGKVNEVLQ